MGKNWRGTYDRAIKGFTSYTVPAGTPAALVYRDNGKAYLFKFTNGQYVSDADVTHRLTSITDASGTQTGWQYVNANDETETYDASGNLLSIIGRTGYVQTLTYSDSATPSTIASWPGLPIRVTDSFGRQLNFAYDTNGRVVKMTGPAGETYQYTYNSGGYLSSVTYPDGKKRTYVYNEQAYTQNAPLPHALTGIVDENGKRFATFKYHSSGRAISTEHAGGAERVTISYNNNNTSTITDALGTVRITTFQPVLGSLKKTGESQPGGAGCGPASSAISYDANGNVASRTDFNGVQTTYSYDLTHNLETRRMEAVGTPEARTISTEWHPTYRLPTKIAEPKRLTIHSYDDQGNLLSKTVQATSDETGAQGFSMPAVGAPRIWRYTYNQYGQVLTATGPRTDVDDTTRYAYDEQGNLSTITNAASQVTTLSQYDAHGRVGKMVDPNGLVTELTYSPRGWLTARTVGGETTHYEYDGVGQLTKVIEPDGAYVAYTYDDAHRLTGIADSLGNRIAYTLDAMGNRVREEVQDPDGVLSRQTTRVYDALNRLQQITGGM